MFVQSNPIGVQRLSSFCSVGDHPVIFDQVKKGWPKVKKNKDQPSIIEGGARRRENEGEREGSAEGRRGEGDEGEGKNYRKNSFRTNNEPD